LEGASFCGEAGSEDGGGVCGQWRLSLERRHSFWSYRAVAEFFANSASALDAAGEFRKSAGTKSFARALAREYPKMEKIAVDYAIMEKREM